MLVINGINWDMQFVHPSDDILMRNDGSYSVACTDSGTKTIYFSDLLSGEFLRKVCCHEVCHAFCFSNGLEMSLDEEERLCDFIATYGIEVIELADLLYSLLRRAA